MLHRTRHLFIRLQTAVINAIRAHLAEFGIVAPVGRNGVDQLLGVVADTNDKRLPAVARACVAALGAHLQMLKAQILQFDRLIRAWHRSSEVSKRLDAIPGVGPFWPLLWLPVSLTRRLSDQEGISRPGSGSSRSKIRGVARITLATSAKEAIVTCAACLRPVRWPSSATPKSMARRIGRGSQRCWRHVEPRSRP